jgi:hypothetical protein
MDVMLRMWPRRRAHVGQHGFDHGDGAEHVDVELPPHVGERRFFHRAFVTIACVVDQNVDRPDGCLDLCNDAVDGVKVGHVQDASDSGMARESLEVLPGLQGSHGSYDSVACGQRFLGERAAEAAADAGDEQGLGGWHDAFPESCAGNAC